MVSELSGARRAIVTGLGAAALGSVVPVGAQPGRNALSHAIAAATKGLAEPVPPLAVRALHRLGFGPARRKLKAAALPSGPDDVFNSDFESQGELGSDDIGYFNSLGGTDDERLEAYVTEQLAPSLIDDSDLEARLAAYPGSFAVSRQSLATVFSQRACRSFDEYVRPYREVEKLALTRAVYSRRQLYELTVDFWHNHFNVYAPLSNHTYASWHSWDRDVIRRYAYGNFYNFLYATATHVTMLRYLDNYRSDVRFNENYAREVMELHTLGAENYRGLAEPLGVDALETNPYTVLGDDELDDPSLAGGLALSSPSRSIAAYYVDNDVYEAAKALTGWRYRRSETGTSCDTAAFYTDDADHTGGQKSVLGRGLLTHTADLPAEQDGRIALKLMAYHPATARHIARKLCQRLIADDPPESVVTAAANTFYANRLSSQQISRTIRTIVLSPEFKDPALWGSKIRRPLELVVAAMRAGGCNHTFREDDPTNTSNDFINTFASTGQRLFNWRPPDGYPDHREHWQGSNTMVQGWRTIDWLTDRDAMDDSKRVMRIVDITLENIQGDPTARQVVEFWCNWLLGYTPDGGWTGPVGTPWSAAPTAIGKQALRFFIQSGFPQRDRNLWTEDSDPIPRDKFRVNQDFEDWNRRTRGLVALILWSPNFAQR
ncbi:DUF1800 domain-containing protein [Chiayiivirga flava]|uniref:Uncharacterized protein (DUF1800 family) n=1 Tax=Chiayiivirga flava TaxID=659595 RepID=A0A7W8D4P7_9GAMM|nr:DUF1800 domain-containing protein [Chiayiivirga flava]MBB5206627.1 uncharacterized protein (DUF1800 family) [Chiayiivirga flava]